MRAAYFSIVRVPHLELACAFCLLVFCLPAELKADQPIVQFDVPAAICVTVQQRPEDAVTPQNPFGSGEKTVEVVIPVSTEVAPEFRTTIEEFRFDVVWNQNAYPLVDYAPKTETQSDIEGVISFETSKDRSGGIGVKAGGNLQPVTASANADISGRDSTKSRYSEVPQHRVFIASGPKRRGTGAFFRFHQSRRDTLEGGRELILSFRVPTTWRAGLLKIECHAIGHQKIIGHWNDKLESDAAFIVPIHLEGDVVAKQIAMQLIQKEHGLKRAWHENQTRPKPNSLLFAFSSRQSSNENLPDKWMHTLIQSGNDDYLQKYRAQLPQSIVESADEFIAARKKLATFSR